MENYESVNISMETINNLTFESNPSNPIQFLSFQAICGTLEKNNIFSTLTWSVVKSVPGYSNISKKCLLCLTEKC